MFTAEEFDAYLTGEREGRTNDLCLEIMAFRDGVAKREFDAIAYAA